MRALAVTNPGVGEERVVVDGREFCRQDKVQLRLGTRRSDSMDTLLNGRVATIENIYRDYDGQVYLAVTLDDDPAQPMQREFARYLFFFSDEVKPLKTHDIL